MAPLALELPEVLRHVRWFLSRQDALACSLVCRQWHAVFQPLLWEHFETANAISPENMEKNALYIRTLSLAALAGLETPLSRCTRLNSLVLWPDAFEDEYDDDEDEDDEDEDEKVEDADGKGSDRGDSILARIHDLDTNSNLEKSHNGNHVGHAPSAGIYHDPRPSSLQARATSVLGSNTNSVPDTYPSLTPAKHQCNHRCLECGFRHPFPPADSYENYSLLSANTNEQPSRELTRLLLRNQNLSRIEVYIEQKSPSGAFWQSLACSEVCPRLSSFQSLLNLQVHRHIRTFWRMCTRLTSLDLERCSLSQLDQHEYEQLSFPRMHEVRLGRIRFMSLGAQLQVIKQCPELRTLEWRVPRLGLPLEAFCRALSTKWSKLSTLILPESRLSDTEFTQILAAAAPLSALSIRRSEFGKRAYESLKRHFQTLKSLDLCQCLGLTSTMTQEILSSCKSLENFDGYRLLVQDMISGSAWQCLEMKHLDLHIVVGAECWLHSSPSSTNALQRIAYRQLAQLENLVHLSVGCKGSRPLTSRTMPSMQANPTVLATPILEALAFVMSPTGSLQEGCARRGSGSSTHSSDSNGSNDSSGSSGSRSNSVDMASSLPNVSTGCGHCDSLPLSCQGLELTLKSGLDELKTLKRLRMVRFTGTEQLFSRDDIEWMVEHWRELRVLQGRLHSNAEEEAELEQLLGQHKIAAWTLYNEERSPYQSYKTSQATQA
ncbi:hypothetical protein BGW38_002840 [Lunasporangiospora selenospora]|uniref:F-box domain-containing protein n=1 Tax=Lunasporangiospora selenospora TaxID=979761 RepID=A0A9P6FS12_9FUNG|nr:hypothetical protein BGW38_002840 [Lunasporangiospora selenospora]